MNGSLKNKGTLGGSTYTLGELDLGFEKFLSAQFSLGAGYHLYLDYSRGSVPIKGMNLFARYYIGNPGSTITHSQKEIVSVFRSRFIFFVGLDLQQRDYFLGTVPLSAANGTPEESTTSTTTQATFSGNFFTTAASFGAGTLISDHLQFLIEGSIGLKSFAASDERMRISANHLSIGISYLW